MEYGMIEGRSFEQLVAVLNAGTLDGWELAGTPVYNPALAGWFAIIRKDAETQRDRDDQAHVRGG